MLSRRHLIQYERGYVLRSVHFIRLRQLLIGMVSKNTGHPFLELFVVPNGLVPKWSSIHHPIQCIDRFHIFIIMSPFTFGPMHNALDSQLGVSAVVLDPFVMTPGNSHRRYLYRHRQTLIDVLRSNPLPILQSMDIRTYRLTDLILDSHRSLSGDNA